MGNKNCKGLSYLEVLIALALFAIVLAAVLPSLLQARRNMEIASSFYKGNLQAHGLMLTVRDAMAIGNNPQFAASNYAANHSVMLYSVWVFGGNPVHFYSHGTPEANVTIATGIAGDASTIIVAVWNEDGNIIGRAVGVGF